MDAPGHLIERDIAGYLDQSLDAAARRAVEVHLDECPACRSELVAVMRLARPDSGGTRGIRRFWWIPVAVAAGLAAVLLVRRPPASLPDTIERPASGVTESLPRLVVTTPAAGAAVPARNLSLQWHSRPGDSYRVTVLSESGAPIWSTETTDTTVVLPQGVLLEPGRMYFWRVDAIADGVSATSGIQQFQVTR